MNVVICGAGQVGAFAAEILAASGHRVTVVDLDSDRLRALAETLDMRTLAGPASHADVLTDAGASTADLVLAATAHDEINIVAASVAKSLGAKRTIARVHDGVYFEGRGVDYAARFGIDRLICPEYSAAIAIARTVRNPGALAIETFARGRIEMQEIVVTDGAPAVGVPLHQLGLPAGTRVVSLKREQLVTLPDAKTIAKAGDIVTLIANADVFKRARDAFHTGRTPRQRISIMGGGTIAVWLCGALRDSDVAIQLFETDREAAEDLAERLPRVTVICADPTDPDIFAEYKVHESDAFVALNEDDEDNIVVSAFARSKGVPKAIAVVQKRRYGHLLEQIGINLAVSPRRVAAREIEELVDDSPIRRLASIADGVLDVFQVRVGVDCELTGVPLREIRDFPNWILAAVDRGGEVSVPGPDLAFQAGDTLLVVGPRALERRLREVIAR